MRLELTDINYNVIVVEVNNLVSVGFGYCRRQGFERQKFQLAIPC